MFVSNARVRGGDQALGPTSRRSDCAQRVEETFLGVTDLAVTITHPHPANPGTMYTCKHLLSGVDHKLHLYTRL